MGGNPKHSEWYSTPSRLRRRKPINLTISDADRETLESEAARSGVPIARLVEAAVSAFMALPKDERSSLIAIAAEKRRKR